MITTELIRFFFHDTAVGLMAPTNAAARLIGGDTAHAMCKLPLEAGAARFHLSHKILEQFQQYWDGSLFTWHDEISMQSSQNLYWIGRRLCQAMAEQTADDDDDAFGGLAVGTAGDFMQIPPVSKTQSQHHSLAVVVDDDGNFETETDKGDVTIKSASRIHRAGFARWRKFATVVSLNAPLRADPALATILTAMRNKMITDDIWLQLQSRVVGVYVDSGKLKPLQPGVRDPRLSAPPFSNNVVQYIVPRHAQRARLAYTCALAEAELQRTRLYLIQAYDAMREGEVAHAEAPAIKQDLLSIASLYKTSGLPSSLCLYIGCVLLLYGKECATYGLMKGCEVVLEQIIFHDQE